MKEDDPAEEGGDLEPSLGATTALDQETAWQRTYPGDDVEDDPAESGIGDADGMAEQFVGEPSLGAAEAVDQRVAWAQTSGLTDGEASGTVDDIPAPYREWPGREGGGSNDQVRH